MKTFAMYLCAAMLAVAASSPCLAAESPWTGTWKMNQAKSKLTGSTYSLTKTASGLIHYSNGGPVSYDFACDGKDYPVMAGRSASCVTTGPLTYTETYKIDGKAMTTVVHVFSADKKIQTSTSTTQHPDGTTTTATSTDTRLSGGDAALPMVGTWKETATHSSSPGAVNITVKDGVMHMTSPENKIVYENKLDGTPAPITGPTVPAGVMTMTKAEGPLKTKWNVTLNGKLTAEGTQTLSADGKTLTEESWIPGKMSEKETIVYEKQ